MNQIVGSIGPDGRPISLLDFALGVRPVRPGGMVSGPARMTPFELQQMYKDKPFIPDSATSGIVPQATQELIQQGVGGEYDLETGQVKPGGIMGMLSNLGDQFSNLSGPETMNLLQGIGGLLQQPDAPTMPSLRMPTETAGIRLPEVDLMQYYKGLL